MTGEEGRYADLQATRAPADEEDDIRWALRRLDEIRHTMAVRRRLTEVEIDPGDDAASEPAATGCPYDPREMADRPIGMFHCPTCGCMVLAGREHPPCDIDFCDYGVIIDYGPTCADDDVSGSLWPPDEDGGAERTGDQRHQDS